MTTNCAAVAVTATTTTVDSTSATARTTGATTAAVASTWAATIPATGTTPKLAAAALDVKKALDESKTIHPELFWEEQISRKAGLHPPPRKRSNAHRNLKNPTTNSQMRSS